MREGRQVNVPPRLDVAARDSVPCPGRAASGPRPLEVSTRRFLITPPLCLALLALAACGSWKRVGRTEPNRTPERIPQVFDPATTYRTMGLLADDGPMGFIGTARILAGPTPDSLIILVALSMRNRGMAFRRDGDEFVAEYLVETSLRRGSFQAATSHREERVRVAAFRETQRSDESIIFQEFLSAAPGDYLLSISVRDRNSANSGRVEMPVSVPALARNAVSLPIAVYQATPRIDLARRPQLVANPRSAVSYGTDSMHFYVETYGLTAGTSITLAAQDEAARIVWTDSLRVDSAGAVRGYVFSVPPAPLTIGRYDLRLSQGPTVMAATPFVVTFSDQFAAANLADIVSLLRYFANPDTLRALLNAPAEERGAAWLRFWKATDPNPATPENEAIDEYLRRVQLANERFRDEGGPGWLTERGEVFINLGEPSEMRDSRPDLQGRGRSILWNYYEYRLSLLFYDDAGFGRLRLEPRSRAEYLRVVSRLRDR